MKTHHGLNYRKKLGNLISRILKGKLNITVHNQIIGNKEMEKKTFIHTAVLVGILSGQTKNGLNLINAPTLAQEIGIDIKRSYEESTNIEAIVIQAEGHWIKGTVRNNKPMLLSLDDALFSDGIILGDFISLYQTSNIQDLAQIVNVFSLKNINICNLNTNGNWMIIQTDREVSIPVNGIESF